MIPRNLKIDAIDCRILNVLQRDSALSMQQISEKVGLSANPCWRRIKRLEDLGVIIGRTILIDVARIGFGMTSYVSIRTNHHDQEWLDNFARGVRSISEIIECHRMTGDFDYLLKIVVADISHYDIVYRRIISKIPGIADISSTFSMEVLKQEFQLDLESLAPNAD